MLICASGQESSSSIMSRPSSDQGQVYSASEHVDLGLVDKAVNQGEDPAGATFRLFEIKGGRKEVVVPHEARVP
jgi:hypothetical protein